MTTAKKNILFFIIFLLLNLQNKTFAVETKTMIEKENLIKNEDKIKIIAEETPIRSFYEELGSDKKNDKKENKDPKSPENSTSTISTEKKIVGSEIDIVSKIFNKLKIPFEIEIVHWTEMLPKMITGEADMAFGIEKNSKFDKYVNFTRTPTYTKNYSFYGLSSQLKDSFVMSFEDAVAHNYSV
ncbi:transporter substrate-binding domain-containing protein, partial [Silvanigrella sp.]|uniref:transporter substrate-binding domain-containing protein n=1 Tax=Silvanigrella sp. TaxID=2024976 RepID=UPI0037C6145D